MGTKEEYVKYTYSSSFFNNDSASESLHGYV